jgi:alpha-mannosidase
VTTGHGDPAGPAKVGAAPLGSRPLHLIGNAHIDPVWIWDWREGFGEVWATFRSALDRLSDHREFVFTASSAAFYAWIEHHDPAMFDEIRAAVASGRWCIVGGMWVEPDCNLPSGESICRQLALGQRYFRRAFGRSARVGFNPDSFGHAAGLPQLLAKSGITAYVFMRPGPLERSLRHTFVWTDPSGSRVTAFRIPVDYGSESAVSTLDRVAEVSAMSEVDQMPLMCFFGVGNHGGGPTESMLKALEQTMAADGRLRYSSPDAYFGELDGLRETLPVVGGELQHHAVGCYSVSAWIKAANRSSESALLDAEVFESAACRLLERQAEQVAFGRAWEQLALCQFHDVLAGTSSESAYRTIRSRFGYVDTFADQVTTNALYEIAHHVDTRIDEVAPQERQNLWSMEQPPAAPFVVCNPLAWPVSQVVEVPRSSKQVLDHEGQVIVSQATSSGETTMYLSHTIFTAKVEALGYRLYWLRGGRMRPVDPAHSPGVPVMECGRFRVVVDEGSGAIVSIVDLASSTELIAPGGIRLVVLRDDSDTWSHGLTRYEGEQQPLEFEGWELVEVGPVRSKLRLRFRSGASRVVVDVTVHEEAPFVELRIRADWHSPQTVVKLRIALGLGPDNRITAGAAYSHQDRQSTGEEVFQGWVDCFEQSSNRGIGFTTDHLYGYDADSTGIRITVLRNPLAGDHGGPWSMRVGEDFLLTDSGPHDSTVRIHPHDGDWRSAQMTARADEHHRPVSVVVDTYHDGRLPGRGSFLQVQPPEPGYVRSVKRSEDGVGTILRLVEPRGEDVSLTLTGGLLGRPVTAGLTPYEVQTLMVPDRIDEPPRVVSIAEFGSNE